MGTGRRRIWPWIGLLLLAAITSVVVAYIVRASNRDAANAIVSTLVSVATAATGVATWLWASRRPVRASRSLLEQAADELAEQVRRQWEGAAAERGLMFPAPIPVQWQWSHRQVTGPVEAAVGGDGEARFAPLPGMVTTTVNKLHSGTLMDLFSVYGGLGSGRLVILGRPGAGKSGAAIRLLLDALTHRSASGTIEERARIPVPVLFTLNGWDPHNEPFAAWLGARLTEEYSLLRALEYGRDVAARMIDGGYIAVILDGFDEMVQELRPVALQALDQQATFRLTVLTRSEEMVAAVGDGHLRGAAALELCSVQAEQAAEYLASTQMDPAPSSWQRLVKHLGAHPYGPLSQALQTPLMVTLVRDAYRPDDPVDELTDSRRFTSREAIESHLLDRVLPAAYARRPGHPIPTYTLDQAQRWLGNLARRMNAEGTRDLAWWQIPHWVPAWPRALATVLTCELVVGLVVGLLVGLLIHPGVGLALPLVSKLGLSLTFGLVIGFMGAFGDRPPRYLSQLRRSKTDIRKNLTVGLAYGLMFGLIGGYVNGLVNGLATGLIFGLTYGFVSGSTVGLMGTFGERSPRHLSRPQWNKTDVYMSLVFGLVAGSMYGLVAWNEFGGDTGNDIGRGVDASIGRGAGAAIVAGLLLWIVISLAVWLVASLGRPSTKATSPIDPRSSWRRNRQFGFLVGLIVALGYVIVQSFIVGLAFSLATVWVVSGLAMGIAVGLVFPATWQVTLASIQLWRRSEVPVRLLRFLEDARGRQVLRTVGQVYQFRHAQLQDRLGAGTTPSATISGARTRSRTSGPVRRSATPL